MKKKEALALAKKNSTEGLISSDSATFKATLDESTGFLKAPVTLARTGVQDYWGYELGLVDRALDKIGVFRSPDEVFSPDAVASFENMIVTDDHPSEPVTTDNVKELQMGQVSGMAKDQGVLTGAMVITDKTLIKKIQDGKVEVSVGYGHDLKPEVGEYQGAKYEFIQTDIRGNHLAVVQAGRCGPACKITTDDEGGTPMIITIDGIEYDVSDKQLAQAVTKLMASHDAEKNAFAEKLEKSKEDKEEAEKAKDKAEAEKEVVSKDVLSDDQLNELVTKRAKLIADATLVIGDNMPDCGCPNKVMAAVVDHVFPDISLDGKSVDYVTATYDMAIAKASKAKKSMDNLGKDFTKDKAGAEVTRDSARDKYMASIGLEV
ncbi:MAG: hypothetical protein DRQ46_07930 [Gammaproteobacteria bacterium]|nr:MAG: hypothetical protein DRQ46_07930 [Gammaproteobacteria bacterium]